MRKFLLIQIFAVMLGVGVAEAAPTPIGNLAPISNVELYARAQSAIPYSDGRLAYYTEVRAETAAESYTLNAVPAAKSFATLARNLFTVAGIGLIGALGAVGVQSLWVQHPMRDPFTDGPE
jgi:hypothetical protein